MKSHWLDTVALYLLVIGGLNWGLVVLGFNLVAYLTGDMGWAETAIYSIVGISALYIIVSSVFAWANHRSYFAHYQ